MFPVQILVVLSMIIIINQAATLNYDNQKSFLPIFDANRMEEIMLYNKTYNANGNYSKITYPYYDSNATGLSKLFKNSNKTIVLPFLPKIKGIDGWCSGCFGRYRC